MIVTGTSANGAQTRILARGNFSLDARGMVLVLLTLGLLSLGLAVVLAVLGYWPILLMAVIQSILVSWLLVWAWRNAWNVEEIDINQDTINVVQQRYRTRRYHALQTAWAVVRVERAEFPGHAPRLLLRSCEQQLELGAYLTTEEKSGLAAHLTAALAGHTAWRTH